jgi:hypothetical protein
MKKTKTLIITAAAVSMLALAACTQTAMEDKNVQTTQAQIDVQKDRTVNLTQDASYPESYRQEVLQTIQTVQDDITGESVSYIFITDLHLDTSEDVQTAAYRQLHAIVDIANNTDVDFVCVGGDLYNGRDAEENGKQIAMNKIESVSEVLEACEKPVFILKGNHDDNSFSAQEDGNLLYDADYIINREEWYSVTMEYFPQYAAKYQNGYYYYDLPGKNTRVVCLNMSDSDDTVTDGKQAQMGMYFYGYSDEQIDWLLNTAMARQDCNYLFMGHDAFDYPQGYVAGDNRDVLREILTAAYTHTPFESGAFEKDFSNWNGNVVLYNSGHLHMERAIRDEETGGLPILNTQISMYSEKSQTWMQDKGYSAVSGRVKDTASEALFNVVISTGDKIQIVRFGAGEDHELQQSY